MNGFLRTELGDLAGGISLTANSTVYRDDGLVNSTTSVIFGSPVQTNTTWFVYDDALRQTHSVQVVNADRDGSVAISLVPTDDVAHPVHGIFNANGEVIGSIYDSSDIIVTETRYDNAGRQEGTIDAFGNGTEFVYDGLGRVVETRTFDPG